MNLLEKAVNDKMNQMEESQTVKFFQEVMKYQPSEVVLNIGQYVEGGSVMMLATVDGRRLEDVTVMGLLNICEYYKQQYLSDEWREAIRGKLNRNRAKIRNLIELS